MKQIEKADLNSFISGNRTNLDESLVSLRFMKEIDCFLDENNLTRREFAEYLGYSESFISQLMSGSKKVNTSFINKLEKTFDVFVSFKVESNRKHYKKFYETSLEFNFSSGSIQSATGIYSFKIDSNQSFDQNTEFAILP